MLARLTFFLSVLFLVACVSATTSREARAQRRWLAVQRQVASLLREKRKKKKKKRREETDSPFVVSVCHCSDGAVAADEAEEPPCAAEDQAWQVLELSLSLPRASVASPQQTRAEGSGETAGMHHLGLPS